MLTFSFLSFVAGILSILAPCSIFMIPLLIAADENGKRKHNPFFVIGGLALSIFVFSILLKSTTLLINVPDAFWGYFSGSIILLFGLITLWPKIWDTFALWLRIPVIAQKQSAKASTKRGLTGDMLLGASLGPVFSACSPTYALIVASILPASPAEGVVYLLLFILGLSLMLGLIAIGGQKLIKKLGWGINPHGIFKRTIGTILLLVGILIITGLDKELLTYFVSNGWFDWQVELESKLNR